MHTLESCAGSDCPRTRTPGHTSELSAALETHPVVRRELRGAVVTLDTYGRGVTFTVRRGGSSVTGSAATVADAVMASVRLACATDETGSLSLAGSYR